MGSYKFLIVDVSNTPTEYYKNGKVVAARVSVTFKEYPYKKKSKKAKTSKKKSSKKKGKPKKGGTKKGSAKKGKTSAKSSNQKKGAGKGYVSYTVKKGDTLWGIAKAKLGSGTKYKKIYNANKTASKGFHKITNPSLILPGWVIRIPKS
ncbi:MAG: LysM peptidoglycan-binding domain-containing protein [Lachnospiraceae bacterium]|nr:LysM peptidoglycan-binding domain-containing protein [Lachnospiraceae bacterium]